MSADTKSLRLRIKSVDSTLHLTKAMGLVASSKIRRANAAMNRGRKYMEAMDRIVKVLSGSPECRRSTYIQSEALKNAADPASDTIRTCMVIIAGDRGMAGGYNANIFRTARDLEMIEPEIRQTCEWVPIGKRSCDRFGAEFISSEFFTSDDARSLSRRLTREFKEGKYDRLCIIATHYVSMMTQNAYVEQILPIVPAQETREGYVLFEPSVSEMLDSVVEQYVAGKIFAAVQESFACEVAARRTAMDSAGKNAQEMIDTLTLQYNRARQGAITQEITEIVAGSQS